MKDWKVELGEGDFVGQAEFRAKWRDGYGAMTAVDVERVKK